MNPRQVTDLVQAWTVYLSDFLGQGAEGLALMCLAWQMSWRMTSHPIHTAVEEAACSHILLSLGSLEARGEAVPPGHHHEAHERQSEGEVGAIQGPEEDQPRRAGPLV